MRTNRELAQLGHFDPEKLNVIPMPNQADGTVDLKYIVEEKPNDQLEISGGWGANMKLLFQIFLLKIKLTTRCFPSQWKRIRFGLNAPISVTLFILFQLGWLTGMP